MTTVLRGTTLTPFAALRDVARLFEAFARPKHWPTDDARVAAMFVETCDDVSAEQFAQAVATWIKGDHRFAPTPGQLRAIAREQPGIDVPGADPNSWEAWLRCPEGATGRLRPCPACGRAWQAQPRITIVHDHARHRAARIPCIDHCDNPKCLGAPLPQHEPKAMSDGELWMPAPVMVPPPELPL